MCVTELNLETDYIDTFITIAMLLAAIFDQSNITSEQRIVKFSDFKGSRTEKPKFILTFDI